MSKGWSFITRGKDSINPYEIADTLSRKNPVAVVTMIPQKSDGLDAIFGARKKPTYIFVHNSIYKKCMMCKEMRTLGEYFLRNYSFKSAYSSIEHTRYSHFDVFSLEDTEHVQGIIEMLNEIRQMKLDDTTEYKVAVNYPKV